MQKLIGSLGAGLVGSIVFFLGNLFFGGTGNSAYTASFWGFWAFAIGSWLLADKRN